jgi:hypothetical protein
MNSTKTRGWTQGLAKGKTWTPPKSGDEPMCSRRVNRSCFLLDMSLIVRHLVWPMLSVSLNCQFLIDQCCQCLWIVNSWLTIRWLTIRFSLDWPFGFLLYDTWWLESHVLAKGKTWTPPKSGYEPMCLRRVRHGLHQNPGMNPCAREG